MPIYTSHLAPALRRSTERDAPAQPGRERLLIDLSGRDSEHGLLGVIDIRGIGIPGAAVEIDEHDQCSPRGSLVAIGQRMVAGESPAQDCCLSTMSG